MNDFPKRVRIEGLNSLSGISSSSSMSKTSPDEFSLIKIVLAAELLKYCSNIQKKGINKR